MQKSLDCTDKVSVVVPCYKVENYLAKCVDSILAQTYHNLEVILVNDGSPDRCGEICDAYAEKDPRVRVIHQTNQGLSQARNSGLEIATGDFILFVDSDDWIHESLVERLHRIASDGSADLAVSNLFRAESESVPEPSVDHQVLDLSQSEAIQQVIRPDFGSMVSSCGKLYRKRLLEEIRFPPGRIHEDAFTTYKVILRCNRIVATTAALYYYRLRPGSIMRSPFSVSGRLDLIDALTERSKTLRSRGMKSSADHSNGQVLAIYANIVDHVRKMGTEEPKGHSEPSLRRLAWRLIRQRQPVKFVAFFALSIVSPLAGQKAYAAYRKRTQPHVSDEGAAS